MAKVGDWGVLVTNTTIALSTAGMRPGAWLKNSLGRIWDGITRGIKSAVDLVKNMYEGGKELLAALGRGDVQLFLDWFRDDPKSAIAGGAAVAVAGWFIGSATGITAMAAGGASAFWGTITGLRLGGIAIGAMLPTLQQAIVGGTSVLVNTDWSQSDKSILEELNGKYLTFLNNFGESTGRLLAGFLLGGGKNNPRMTINITGAAALIITAQQQGSDIQDEITEALAGLANTFIRYATNLAGKLGYLQLRKWARANVHTGIEAIDNKIKNWGLIEGESFVISQKIEEKIDKIKDDDPTLGNILEGFYEGLTEGFSDFIVLT